MRTILWKAIMEEEKLAQNYRLWADKPLREELRLLFQQLGEAHLRHADDLRTWMAKYP